LAFADGLKTILDLPGASQFAGPIRQVVDILATEATQAGKQPKVATRPPTPTIRDGAHRSSSRGRNDAEGSSLSGRNDANAVQPPGARSHGEAEADNSAVAVLSTTSFSPPQPGWATFDGRTVVPAADDMSRACALTGNLWPVGEASKGYCARVARGPLIITDLHSPSACPAELFALAVTLPGDLAAPRWAGYAQPANAINVSGGSLVVRDTEYLVIGTMSTSDQRIKRDLRCSVTWGGWRPPAANELPQSCDASGIPRPADRPRRRPRGVMLANRDGALSAPVATRRGGRERHFG
jgi:hypothetical protein